jgi:hypothetical protein
MLVLFKIAIYFVHGDISLVIQLKIAKFVISSVSSSNMFEFIETKALIDKSFANEILRIRKRDSKNNYSDKRIPKVKRNKLNDGITIYTI